MNNEFTVTSRFSKNINHNDSFELIIRDSNGFEIKTRACLISVGSDESFYGRSFDYTFQVDDRIDEQE